MAAEAEDGAAATATEETPVATDGNDNTQDEEDQNAKQNGKGRPRRDETPIEELYDLSQPIPRVERPDKAKHEAELAEFEQEIERIKAEREKTQATIDSMMQQGRGSEIGKERDALQVLRKKKGKLIDEKKSLRSRLDAIRDKADKLAKDRKDARTNIRYSNVEEIEKEITKLKRRQETTSMSLQEEKKLIKEMESLQKSKEFVADLKSKETSMDDVREQRKTINAQLADKDKQIDAVQQEIEAGQTKIDELNNKETDKRDKLKELFAKRDEMRKQTGEVIAKKDKIRQEYREKNNSWFNYQRAIRAQKKIQYEEEKKKREEEYAAWVAAKEAEEAKKVPYEEEMALCDDLVAYLERTFIKTETAEAGRATDKKNDVVAVSDNPFAGMMSLNKKKDDENQDYFGKGKGKKKSKRSTKEKKMKEGVVAFRLNIDTFEQFGLLELDPPTKVEQVPKAIEDLKAKKKWYSEQPRGAVKTATEIRKEKEREAARLRGNNADGSAVGTTTTETAIGDGGKGGSKGNFSLSSDDFAPLGSGAAASPLNAQWGQKPAEEEPVVDTPAAADETAPDVVPEEPEEGTTPATTEEDAPEAEPPQTEASEEAADETAAATD